MTQDLIDKYFATSLGEQCNSLFSTPDNMVFIRKEEAEMHVNMMMNADPENYVDTEIIEWFQEYSGKDIEPKIRNTKEMQDE